MKHFHNIMIQSFHGPSLYGPSLYGPRFGGRVGYGPSWLWAEFVIQFGRVCYGPRCPGIVLSGTGQLLPTRTYLAYILAPFGVPPMVSLVILPMVPFVANGTIGLPMVQLAPILPLGEPMEQNRTE